MYDAVQYQFQLRTTSILTPGSGQHYSPTPSTIPLKVFVNMTPAIQLTACLSIRKNDENNRKAIILF